MFLVEFSFESTESGPRESLLVGQRATTRASRVFAFMHTDLICEVTPQTYNTKYRHSRKPSMDSKLQDLNSCSGTENVRKQHKAMAVSD